MVHPADELRTVVREAATLNLMFLSDLSGLEPLPLVRTLVTSFEACTDDGRAAARSSGDHLIDFIDDVCMSRPTNRVRRRHRHRVDAQW